MGCVAIRRARSLVYQISNSGTRDPIHESYLAQCGFYDYASAATVVEG